MDIETQKNKLDSIAVWSITPNGMMIGQKIHKAVKGSSLFVSKKIWQDHLQSENKNQFGENIVIFTELSKEIQQQFNNFTGHVFIFSTGIAVRIIAPLLKSKTVDPAVVVMDDKAKHVISLLSGHIGGANELSKDIATIVQAVPVITTATDTNNLPSIDMIAKAGNLFIENPQNIKYINMAFLTGKSVGLYDPLGVIKNRLPKVFWTDLIDKDMATEDTGMAKKQIFCSHRIKKVPRETLILRPPVLSVGIGCNRGTKYKDIKEFLLSVFTKHSLSVNSIERLGTTQVKKDETGLLELSDKMQIKIDFYSNKELNSVETIKTPSQIVEKHLGVKSVCEAAAILSSSSMHHAQTTQGKLDGKLIVLKQKNKDVTIAVAIKK